MEDKSFGIEMNEIKDKEAQKKEPIDSGKRMLPDLSINNKSVNQNNDSMEILDKEKRDSQETPGGELKDPEDPGSLAPDTKWSNK